MTTDREPEHIFRIQYYEGPTEYLAADIMDVTHDGIVQLWVTQGLHSSSHLVASFVRLPGLTITRIDCLITREGLTHP